MANEPAFYVEIDDAWHEINENDDSVTACALPIPYPGTEWTRTLPDEVHCGANKTEPKAKAKK